MFFFNFLNLPYSSWYYSFLMALQTPTHLSGFRDDVISSGKPSPLKTPPPTRVRCFCGCFSVPPSWQSLKHIIPFVYLPSKPCTFLHKEKDYVCSASPLYPQNPAEVLHKYMLTVWMQGAFRWDRGSSQVLDRFLDQTLVRLLRVLLIQPLPGLLSPVSARIICTQCSETSLTLDI